MATTTNGDDNANIRAKEIPPARRAVSWARSREQLGAAIPLPQACTNSNTHEASSSSNNSRDAPGWSSRSGRAATLPAAAAQQLTAAARNYFLGTAADSAAAAAAGGVGQAQPSRPSQAP